MPFVKIFHDPGIGFPWMGKRGVAITAFRTRHRGFGIWIHREKYVSSTLRVGIWWVFGIEFFNHCA